MADEFTGISGSSSGLFTSTILALANKTGVTSKTDQANVSLHVKGDVSIDGAVHMCSFKTFGYSQVSDKRIKSDPHTLRTDDAVEQVKQIKMYTYNVKPPGYQKAFASMGVFAQELRAINPILVDTPDDEKDLLAVHYDRVSVLLVPCVQKNLNDVAKVTKTVDTNTEFLHILMDKISKLEEKVDQLEKINAQIRLQLV